MRDFRTKRFFTTGDISRYCEVDINTVKRWIRKGLLEAFVTPSGHNRIERESFIRFLKKQGFAYDPDLFGDGGIKNSILLIDSNIAERRRIVRILRNHAPQLLVEEAQDSYEGFLKFHQHRHRLVLFALRVPNIASLEFIRALRNHYNPGLVEVAVAAPGFPRGFHAELEALNVRHRLSLPISEEALLELARQVMPDFSSGGEQLRAVEQKR